MDYSEEEKREFLLQDAKREMARLKAMRLLIEAEDDLEAKLKIDGNLEHAFSSAGIFLPIIDGEIAEIQKAVDGKPNKWE